MPNARETTEGARDNREGHARRQSFDLCYLFGGLDAEDPESGDGVVAEPALLPLGDPEVPLCVDAAPPLVGLFSSDAADGDAFVAAGGGVAAAGWTVSPAVISAAAVSRMLRIACLQQGKGVGCLTFAPE